ncbi:MAG: hypothetical protein QXK37_05265, partial [Candidatus Woesearchaeota archaeon]
ILNKKSEQNLFWLFYLIPIALYYIQRQFVPERQLIFLPAFVVISVIGVSWAEQKLKKKRYKIIYLLTFLTIISYISLVAFFPDLFPKEWSGIRGGIAGFI